MTCAVNCTGDTSAFLVLVWDKGMFTNIDVSSLDWGLLSSGKVPLLTFKIQIGMPYGPCM